MYQRKLITESWLVDELTKQKTNLFRHNRAWVCVLGQCVAETKRRIKNKSIITSIACFCKGCGLIIATPTYQRVGPERSSEVEVWPRDVGCLSTFLCSSCSEGDDAVSHSHVWFPSHLMHCWQQSVSLAILFPGDYTLTNGSLYGLSYTVAIQKC